MKLEPKHIIKHLPYAPMAEILDYKRDYVNKQYDKIVGLHQWDKKGDFWCVITLNGAKPNIDRIKLALHPLSDLTKPMTHKGETFVPIEKLAKIGTREHKCHVTNSNLGTCFVEAEYRKDGFFMYHPNGYFIWQVGKNAEEQTVYNQKELFELLLEWNFDVDNLIGHGLAVDINTLK